MAFPITKSDTTCAFLSPSLVLPMPNNMTSMLLAQAAGALRRVSVYFNYCYSLQRGMTSYSIAPIIDMFNH